MKPHERPWAEKGAPSENDVFTAVGKALSQWEMVEGAIASLFTIITVDNYHAPTTPTLRAYASVVGSANRIRMVQAALESWLLNWPDCPLAPNVTALLNECSSWAGRRNDIAHGLVDMFLDDARWYLIPSLYTTKGRTLRNNPVAGRPLLHKSDYRYNAEIIYAFADEFLALYNRLNQATSALGEWHRIEAARRDTTKD